MDERTPPTSSGASIEIRDPRVSKAIGWGMGLFGTATVLIGSWIATSINSLNVTMAKVLTQNDAFLSRLNVNESRDDRQDNAIGQLQRDVAVIEGKTFRGVPGYEKGARRGN